MSESEYVTSSELTKSLGEFTDKVLLPAMSTMMDEKTANLVTKDYLDEKLSDQTGDLTVLLRKEDRKLTALIEILKLKRIITELET